MGRTLTNNFSLAMAIEDSLGVAEGAKATSVLTFSGQPSDTETVTIDSKTYTFQASLTDVDGNVLIGGTVADTIQNLVAAITLGGGAGTAYAASMTIHPTVTVSASDATTMTIQANSGGTAGNSIATTDTSANLDWTDTVMAGGTDPVYYLLEPNGINQFGASITTVPRNPISKKRQRRKGAVTDLDSAVEFDHDITLHFFELIAEGFCFATWQGTQWTNYGGTDITVDGSAEEFTVPDLSVTPAAGWLIWGAGFTNAANNGLHEVSGSPTATTIPVTTDLTTEATPSTNAIVEVAGVRGASGDLEIDSNGDLISTSLDFTTLPLVVGQAVHVGGLASANRFTATANFGFARIDAIAANKLTLSKKKTVFVTDDGTGKQVDVLFGRFVTNVAVDDALYLERSFHFEGATPNLEAGGATGYEYSKGNYCNQIQFNIPRTNKATVTAGFVGTDTDDPTTTRKNGASAPINPLKTSAFNTSADVLRLRVTQVDETGLTTDFTDVTFTLNNNASPEKVIGVRGAKYINVGNFEVDIESTVLFTSSAVIAAIRANTTVTADFALRNDEGAIFVDIPSCTLGGDTRNFPENESITLDMTVAAFEDATLGTSVGISLFPFVPSS